MVDGVAKLHLLWHSSVIVEKARCDYYMVASCKKNGEMINGREYNRV